MFSQSSGHKKKPYTSQRMAFVGADVYLLLFRNETFQSSELSCLW